jgi:hypothetical protein
MIKQFDTLNRCLQELGRHPTRSIGKLKLEVQLILTKRVLLDRAVELRVAGNARSEDEFHDISGQVRLLCSSNFPVSTTDYLVARLEQVRTELRNYLVPKGESAAPAQSFGFGIPSVFAGKFFSKRKTLF